MAVAARHYGRALGFNSAAIANSLGITPSLLGYHVGISDRDTTRIWNNIASYRKSYSTSNMPEQLRHSAEALAYLLLDAGYNTTCVADILMVHRKTTRRWQSNSLERVTKLLIEQSDVKV